MFKDSTELLENAKKAYIDAVLLDLRARFADLNEQTDAFEVLNDISVASEADLQNCAEKLSSLYDRSFSKIELEKELVAFQVYKDLFLKEMNSFEDIAKHVITELDPECYPILKRLYAILLTFPVSTADCERGFSRMNQIKSKRRSRMKAILESLMEIYTSDSNRLQELDLAELSKVLAYNLWQKDGKKWASDQYMMPVV